MKNKVAYISDPIYLKHDTGVMHPESPQRVVAIEQAITSLKDKLIMQSPIRVSESLLRSVHPQEHIEKIKEYSMAELSIDGDTLCSRDSYDAARMAVGAGVVAVDSIKSGLVERAFCAVRPPGHHATADEAMGFCLFNNIALTAKYAQSCGYHKVLIVDFDVHHGNGTQAIFWEDKSVFYLGSHQAYTYPGSGSEREIGAGKGEGYTSNHPMMPDSGDKEILEIYEEEFPKVCENFVPDILLVSAGYDLHESDPLAALNVTTEGIRQIVRILLDGCDIPSIFMLEGGYDTEALGRNVKATLEEMFY